ncbi:MAG: YraN family protein [Deltaproteobacteria bacterium]|nr:YraN family protein [Deltaproteobacteria bacterium]
MELTKKQIGAEGEDEAEQYLIKRGYKIIGRNMNTRYGEIDLVAQKQNCLYFVEIRRRVGGAYGSALESLSSEKINRIKKTAHALLFKNKGWSQLIPFFSVIAIDETRDGRKTIEFMPDAFE